jgi:hypothetical protein
MKKDEFFREYLHQKQFDHWRTWSVHHFPIFNVLNSQGIFRRDPAYMKVPSGVVAET